MLTLVRKHLFAATLLLTVAAITGFQQCGVSPARWEFYTYLGCAALLFVMEQIIPRDRSWNYGGHGGRFRYKNAAVDLVFLLFINPYGAMVRLSLAIWIGGLLSQSFSLPQLRSSSAILQTVLLVLVADFFRYCIHRSQHGFAPLWRFHALHHMPDRLIAISSSRVHPVDDITIYTAEAVLYIALGFDAGVVAGVYSVVWVLSLLNHSNLDIELGWLGCVFMHPRYHVRHHRLLSGTEKTYNYGEITTLWDRIFGTFKTDPLGADFKVGVLSEGRRSLPRELLGSFYLRTAKL